MQNEIEYSVILPSYMEAENLRVLLPQIKKNMASLSCSFEIIVIDANKKIDATPEICSDNQTLHVHRSPCDSYGDAVRSGINAGQGRWLIFMDSDGSHPATFIPNLISASEKKDNAIVIASRYIKGGDSANNKILVLMSKLLNMVYSRVLNINCKDISNSFRIYPSNLLKGLSLECDHFDIVEEILYKMIKKNPSLTIVEVPFSFKQRIHGESKRNFIIFLFNYLKTLIKLRCSM